MNPTLTQTTFKTIAHATTGGIPTPMRIVRNMVPVTSVKQTVAAMSELETKLSTSSGKKFP